MFLAACASEDQKTPQSIIEEEKLRKNGNMLIENGNPKDAISVFDKLILLDPANVLAYNGKAIAFDHSGNHLAAQDIYKTALSIEPDSLLTKNNLAMSLILNQQIDQAIELLEPLVKDENNKTSPYIIFISHNLALAYGISGDHEKATKLNLRNMTKEQAQENIRFYEKYTKRKGKAANRKKKERNIGFIAATTSATVVRRPAPSTAKSKIVSKEQDDKNTTFMGKSAVYIYPN